MGVKDGFFPEKGGEAALSASSEVRHVVSVALHQMRVKCNECEHDAGAELRPRHPGNGQGLHQRDEDVFTLKGNSIY